MPPKHAPVLRDRQGIPRLSPVSSRALPFRWRHATAALSAVQVHRGAGGSNPFPSSRECTNFRFLARFRYAPRRSSGCRIVWLSAEGVTPTRAAAARKLRLSSNRDERGLIARSARRIPELVSTPNATNVGLSFGPLVNTLKVQKPRPAVTDDHMRQRKRSSRCNS